ncbi:glycosyltransferase [Sphingomonas japonica]|uniref:Glycosyltransferase involved in cell wall biosynthesis n=1 Tax=Sphingomonas japonica TaxID=511662 RepID=A0ABX0TZP5_9SPHN|nr:glycosyltransferase [Sphingomonas japonica]NIJ23789.1 glycosyltransferase involved in cell wall biosynthesis [Sphingomonas japonica]
MTAIPSPQARHILSFAQSLDGGGVERALLRMAGGWAGRGRRVTLLIGDASGPLAGEVPPSVETVELGDARYTALLAIAERVRAAAPDLIFCPGNHYSAIAAMLRLRLGRKCPPIVGKLSNALVRGDQPAPVAWGYRRWLKLHPRFLDALVAMTPGMAREAEAAMAMPHDRIAVIANPPPTALSDAAPIALPQGRFVLGVGRLARQKRWDRALAAFALLPDRDLSLLIAGEGDARGALEAQARTLGIADRVTLPGYVADPLPAMRAAALVLLTSDFEGVPGVLREAIALGTPVVATDASVAVREIVGPDQGSVVAREDAAGLVAAIGEWLERPRPEVPVGREEDSIDAYLALFDEVISGPAFRFQLPD